MSELVIYLCSLWRAVLDRVAASLGQSSRSRDDYLPFDNTSTRDSQVRGEKVVLFVEKVKSVVTKWWDTVLKVSTKWWDRDLKVSKQPSSGQYYKSNILSSVGRGLLKELGYHPKPPNLLLNSMERLKLSRLEPEPSTETDCQQTPSPRQHFACTCSNSCNTSSFRYCRNRYDKQYDFKYGVWSRTASSINSAQSGEENWMYGRYTKELGEFAKEEAKKLKSKRKKDRLQADELHNKYRGRCATKFATVFGFVWQHTFAKLGEDWVFLALLGIIMAALSFFMDRGINFIGRSRLWLYQDLTTEPFMKYLAWVTLPICLILFSAGFVHIVAPQSIGSGIPEMKTILRGVALKEYLTFNTLVAKSIGLTATLGSGLPLGKEGPFVHIASIVATLLSKVVTSFQGIYQNESRNTEMLAAACAVGVGSCFGAPIGGVLFSIEVTTVYFAIRNYWRGFFTAVCGATVFRLLAVWFNNEETMRAFFPTNFTMDYPFDPQELIVFALIGVVCGFGGAGYVWSHRQYVLFMRRNKKMNAFLQKNRFLYPGIVVLMATSVSFPLGLGKYMAGDLNNHDLLSSLFSNFTWTKGSYTVEEQEVLKHWTTSKTDVFTSLTCFMLYTYVFSIIASTIPVPSGSFIPVFKIGAAFGRLVGEIIFLRFPNGITHGKFIAPIIPGGYATVGAAAFSGAVTHTISVSVIMFEMTGQITHIIPVMIAVLISNAIAALLQPSLYDSIILIKKLPYLPDLLPSSSGIYNVYVEDFMVRDVKYIWNNMTYRDLKHLLKHNRTLRVLPLVESQENMILLGSIQRIELIKLIETHIGRERRLQMVAEWQKAARERFEQMEIQRRHKERERRPSRFEVTPAPDLLRGKSHGVSASTENITRTETMDGPQFCPVFGCQPKKSILKKTNSFSLKNFSPMLTPNVTPYTTVTGAESRIRLAFEAIFHKSATLQDANPDPESAHAELLEEGKTRLNNVRIVPAQHPVPPSPGPFKKVQLPRERVIDMSPEDQKKWEEEEMGQRVSFEQCHIDPAPFQLVERTSLLKVHSIFSLVGVNHAYVTAIGKLVGVVGLKELRTAIENSNSGIVQPPVPAPPPEGGQQTPLLNEDTINSVSSMSSVINIKSTQTSS